jgi:hypothetical protein
MENKVNLDLNWMKRGSFSQSNLGPRDSLLPGQNAITNISEVQSSDIFIRKYNSKLKKIKNILNPIERIASNSIFFDQKLIERMISANEDIVSYPGW